MSNKIEENIGENMRDYFIGLDIGTDSVGWAVTDEEYRLLKSSGSPLWGAYLFDAAQTAEERRKFRTARRRLARVRHRLLLLQSLFRPEIEKVDPTFFIRLNNSALHEDDKNPEITTKYILFGDADYNDKDYFKQFPTIFHLRKYLSENPPQDIRLLYLACHHIIKNRGHFLYNDEKMASDGSGVSTDFVRDAFESINAVLDDGDEESATVFDPVHCDEAISILRRRDTKSDKQRALNKLFGITSKDKRATAVVKLITGGECKASMLYGIELDDEKINLSVIDDVGFEKIKAAADDGCLLDNVKAIYDWSVLVDILNDEKSISRARVKTFDMHKSDLKLLKKFVREECPHWYDEKKNITFSQYVFRHLKDLEKVNNYAAYIGMDKHKSYAKAKKDDFFDFLKKKVFVNGCGFEKFVDRLAESGECDEYVETAVERFNDGNFLPKQIGSGNGVIPYQLHKAELDAILDAAKEKYAFLCATDESGLTVAEKIVALLKFRIPYYVGPLGGGAHAWAERRAGMERVSVTPWNFDAVIDRDASEEKFIKNMTCKCTYIPTAYVLPADSLLYKEAIFLNELNNIKINGVKDNRAIDLIYNEAHSCKKITKKRIIETLKNNGYDMSDITKESITGIDGDMKNSLSSHIAFSRILGDLDGKREMCEEIILWSTLFSDKDRLVKRIKEKYGDVLTERQIVDIKGLTFTKWGRLSRELLDGEIVSEKAVGASGSGMTVIETMRAEKINLSEALTSERWGFADAIEEYNKNIGNDDNRSLDDLYCSPAVKRAIRRTLALVKEIVKIEKHAPQKIMIEVTRGGTEEQKGKRTQSKKEKLLELYRAADKDAREFSKFISEIEQRESRDFDSKKLFAYYMQQGKCMYSGEPIDINELFDDNKYDFDHIFPQSKINDDSFDNKVLVQKKLNHEKKDVFPLPSYIRIRMAAFWEKLHKSKFISDKKYERLTRTTPLTAAELYEFENRQLVITAQSTKVVADILKEKFPDTKIIYSKASKAAEFKHSFDAYAEYCGCDEKYRHELIKVRELNNLHHAKDAYINIVVGNVLNTEYGHAYYKDKDVSEMRSDYRVFRHGVNGAWDPRRDIPTVFDTFYNDNCRVVRFVQEGTGKLFDATVETAKPGLIPLKASGKLSDTAKYGGYNSAKTAYFTLVKSESKKGEKRLSLEAIPVMAEVLSSHDKDSVKKYVENNCGLKNPQIVVPKIRLSSLLLVNGSPAYITGKTGNRILVNNAAELYVDKTVAEYIKKVVSFYNKYQKSKQSIEAVEQYDKVSADKNVGLYDLFIQKLGTKMYAGLSMKGQADSLSKCRDQFVAMSVEKQCENLIKILRFFNTNAVNLDLSDFIDENGKACGNRCGINLISKFVEKTDIKWVVQSPTGKYRQVIDFKKFL